MKGKEDFPEMRRLEDERLGNISFLISQRDSQLFHHLNTNSLRPEVVIQTRLTPG